MMKKMEFSLKKPAAQWRKLTLRSIPPNAINAASRREEGVLPEHAARSSPAPGAGVRGLGYRTLQEVVTELKPERLIILQS